MNAFYEQSQLFTRLWMDMATRMASSGMSTDPKAAPPDLLRQFRDSALSSMAAATEQFMRSPQFLEFTKQSVEASIALRKQMNTFMTRMHHEMQGTAKSDIDAILQNMRHLETRVLDRIEALCDRVESVSKRLEAMETVAARPGNGEPPKPPAAAPERPALRQGEG